MNAVTDEHFLDFTLDDLLTGALPSMPTCWAFLPGSVSTACARAAKKTPRTSTWNYASCRLVGSKGAGSHGYADVWQVGRLFGKVRIEERIEAAKAL